MTMIYPDYRAAWAGDLPMTSPEQAHLPRAELIEAAVKFGYSVGAIGTDGGWPDEESYREALSVDPMPEPAKDDEDVPEPVAAGYAIVQTGHAIFGVGATEAEAWADAREWVDRDEDGEPSLGGLDCEPASQALIDLVREHGAPTDWGEVDGVLCTEDQEEAYTD